MAGPDAIRDNRSEVENQIARHGELIVPSTVVVSFQIPGTLETQFRTYLDGCADPMTPRDRVLRISGGVAGALAFLVIEKVTAERQEVMQCQFLLQEIDYGIFRRGATLFSRSAVRGIRACFRPNCASHRGHVALIHVPGFGRHVQGLRKLVIPGGVILLKIVVRVLAVIDAVGTDVKIVIHRHGRIAEAARTGSLRIGRPRGNVVAGRNSKLHEPPISKFKRRHQTCVGKWVDRVKQRVAEDVVVRRQLCLDPRHGDEAAYSQIHTLNNLRDVDIDVFEGGIKTVLAMIVQQLAAQVSLRNCEAIVRAVEGGKVVAPVDMIALNGIG